MTTICLIRMEIVFNGYQFCDLPSTGWLLYPISHPQPLMIAGLIMIAGFQLQGYYLS